MFVFVCMHFSVCKLFRLTGRLNAMHMPMFVVQICASTLIICLTGFIATISVTKDMSVFVKYLTEMIAAFAQLLYWCWVGNKVFAEVGAHTITQTSQLIDY